MVLNLWVGPPPKAHKMNLVGREMINGTAKKKNLFSATLDFSSVFAFFFCWIFSPFWACVRSLERKYFFSGAPNNSKTSELSHCFFIKGSLAKKSWEPPIYSLRMCCILESY